MLGWSGSIHGQLMMMGKQWLHRVVGGGAEKPNHGLW